MIRYCEHYRRIVASCDRRVDELTFHQVTDTGDPNYGGIRTNIDGLSHPGSVFGALLSFISAYECEDSRHHASTAVADRIRAALTFAENVQRPDGTYDLLPSNFFSSPDNGFIMHSLARIFRIADASSDRGLRDSLVDRLYGLIRRTADGIVEGGFHTPNHRWVNAAALALAYNITGTHRYLEAAEQYLAEGIDIDQYGEFTERSAGIYNAVNDNALTLLSQELGRPDLFDYILKNLNLMLTYLEPDGSVFTWNSTRQDKGEGGAGGSFDVKRYYHIYLQAACIAGDGRYAAVAQYIADRLEYDRLPPVLHLFLLQPELADFEIEPTALPTAYHVHYPDSGVVRARTGDVTYTLLRGSSSFLFVRTPDVGLRVKLCASFFAVAQFVPESLEPTSKGAYRMTFHTAADYRMPLDPPPETPEWRLMDHGRRRHVKKQTLLITVETQETADGLSLRVRTEGCDRVPLKLEMITDAGAVVTGSSFVITGPAGAAVTARAGDIEVARGACKIGVGPAFGLHHYTTGMRGSEPQSAHGFTIYFTDFTPVDRTISIRAQAR